MIKLPITYRITSRESINFSPPLNNHLSIRDLYKFNIILEEEGRDWLVYS
jgi:hypothetical protein